MEKTKAKAKTKTKVKAKPVQSKISEKDRKLAKFCVTCPVCKLARKKQKGAAFWFVSKIEGNLCPFCKAYERVYGRKAHQPLI
jgi:uncharacterized protein CbrC (UPF0167 family)